MLSTIVKKRYLIALSIFALLIGHASYGFAADAAITVSGGAMQGDVGNITISFHDSVGNNYSETVFYGPFSTVASIASAFGGEFSAAYVPSGLLCVHAVGSVIYFHLKGTATFGPPNITNPSVSYFFTPSSAWPHLIISGITPDPAAIGATVTITGMLFGSAQGSSTVAFNGTVAGVVSWAQNAIVVTVPSGATTGNVVVTVNGSPSNGFLFMVPTPCP